MSSDRDSRDSYSRDEEIRRLLSTIAAQQRDNESLKETVDAQARLISVLRDETALAQKSVVDIQESTAWRVTSPLRALMDVARRAVWRLRARREGAIVFDGEVRRLYEKFDPKLDRETRRTLRTHLDSNPALADTLVSIVMPTYNRGEIIGKSIKSVLNQTHQTWELLIVDDGSTDDTEEVVARMSMDPRIQFVKMKRAGVGAARNAGLARVRGEVIAYLDSDNEWDTEFLSLMVAGLDMTATSIGFSATALIDNGRVLGYRGDDFDYEKCLDANYVDINSFCHRKEALGTGIEFDPKVRRTNDWDFILSVTYGQPVSYQPFVGVRYSQSERPDQITRNEPYIFRRLVEFRHRRRFEGLSQDLESFDEAIDNMPYSFAIRTASPREGRDLWGDHHLAVGLATALERLGHSTDIYCLDEELREKYDVVLILRGLTRYAATPEAVNVIWNISHPDQVDFRELEEFDIVCIASNSYHSLVTQIIGENAVPLLQATDSDRFYPHQDVDRGDKVLFVGNSRKVDRPTVRYAIEADLPLVIHGSGWDGMVPSSFIGSTYLPNEEASRAYASAAVVLNDHWESMKDFGFVSNRIYDALASGAIVVSDTFPELERMFGDQIATFSDRGDFVDVVHRVLDDQQDEQARLAAANNVLTNHSLDMRAAAILDQIRLFIGKAPASPDDLPARTESDRRRGTATRRSEVARIGVIPQRPGGQRLSSSAYIRLIQPLTSDLPAIRAQLTVLEPDDLASVREQDMVVVSRTAVATVEAAELLLDATDGGTRLAVDIDDAFHLMDASHPQFDEYRERLPALMRLMGEAANLWCSTQLLEDSLPSDLSSKTSVIHNTIDPRLWRRYRKSWRSVRTELRLEILYLGSVTHGADLDLLLPVFEGLHEEHRGAVRLTVVGVPTQTRDPAWLRRLAPAYKSDYPYYAQWLRGIAGDFDLGVAPLIDNQFNRMKSDIKVLEYTALGLPTIASPVGPYLPPEEVETCSSADEWYKALTALITDPSALDERRIRVEHFESRMWTQRHPAKAGELMVGAALRVDR